MLVVMTDHHIGNLIVSMPTLRRLHDEFDGPIDTLVAAPLAGLAGLLIPPRILEARRRRGAGGVADLLSIVRRVAGRYGTVIDVGGGVRSSTIVAATLARRRVGLRSHPRSFIYNVRLPGDEVGHRMQRYARILRCTNAAPPERMPPVEIPEDARQAARAALDAVLPEPARPFAVVHAGAGKPHRIWPAPNFARAADHLVRTHRLQICFIGTPGERERTDAAIESMDEHASACRLELPLLPLFALLDRAELLLCNESGPMHMAALTRCPIVALYGATSPDVWAPLRATRTRLLRADADPDGQHRIERLAVEQVIATIDDLMEESEEPSSVEVRAIRPLPAC